MSDLEPDPGYAMFMPFIVCGEGKPYDASSFVAGARMEAIRQLADSGEKLIRSYEPPALVPQLDLIAMSHGYSFKEEPWEGHEDEWTLVTMEKLDNRG